MQQEIQFGLEASSAVLDNSKKTPAIGMKAFLMLLFLGAFAWLLPLYFANPEQIQQDNRLKIERNSGRNGKHSNQKARESAEQKYQKAKEEYEYWDKKPNKTPDEKKFVKKLRKQVERLRLKKDFKGENHSQKNKGN